MALSSKLYFMEIFLKTDMCPCWIYPVTSGKGLTLPQDGFILVASVSTFTSCVHEVHDTTPHTEFEKGNTDMVDAHAD